MSRVSSRSPTRGLLAAVLLSLVAPLQAAPGDLDLRFGVDGVLFIGRGGGQEQVGSLLAAPGNAVLAGGGLYTPAHGQVAAGYDMSVVRLLANGDLDPAFADGGLLQVGLNGDQEYVAAMVRQPDGAIVAAGTLEPQSYRDFGVIRFDADGRLDAGFGDPDPDHPGLRLGFTHFNMGPNEAANDEARAVALQSDGHIIVAGVGYAVDGAFVYPRFAMARLDATGQLDASFAEAGRLLVPAAITQSSEYLTAIALRADGRLADDDSIVLVGYSSSTPQALVRRFLANGEPDPGFGDGGLVVLTDRVVDGRRQGLWRVDDAVLQEDGGIVLVGRGADRGFTFVRLRADGSVDPQFGGNGRTLVKFSASTDYDEPSVLRLQRDGKLVAAGYATGHIGNSSSQDFASVRLRADGVPDLGYGDGSGRSSYPLVDGDDSAATLAVMSDGSLLFAGRADVVDGSGGDDDAAFLRLQGDPGIFHDGFESR